MKKLLCLIILLFSFCMPVWATTYYVEPGGSGVSTNQGSPGGLYDSWNDMCAGITISDGDTICLLDGTYDDTTNDVPVAGLGDYSGTFSITVESNSGNPTDVDIDFSSNTGEVDGFHVTTSGTFTFKGLTIHGQQATSLSGNITMIDGCVKVQDCIIYGGDCNAVRIISASAAASVYLYNCEIYDTGGDGVSASGSGGAEADRIMEAHYCYFHGINVPGPTQAMTMHNNGRVRAYFCRFKNIGSDGGGAIAHGYESDNHSEVYNCVFEDCRVGVSGSGNVIVKNSFFNIIDTSCVVMSLAGSGEVIVEDCIFMNYGKYAISAANLVDLTVRRCCIKHGTGGYVILGDLNGDNAITFTLEDCIIYYAGSDDIYIVRAAAQTWNVKRNLIWSNGDSHPNSGIFSLGNVAQTGGVVNFEHNCIRKAGTDQLFYVLANPTTYNGGYNNWTTGSPLSAGNRMGTIKDTDQWCAAHPDSDLCISCFCELPEALNCNSKSRAFWSLMSKLTGWDEMTCPNLSDSIIVNFDDFSVLADNWLGDSSKPGDLDGDGIVNVNDLLILSAYWLLDCNID